MVRSCHVTLSDVPPEPSISKIRSCQLNADPMTALLSPWPVIVNVFTGQRRGIVDDESAGCGVRKEIRRGRKDDGVKRQRVAIGLVDCGSQTGVGRHRVKRALPGCEVGRCVEGIGRDRGKGRACDVDCVSASCLIKSQWVKTATPWSAVLAVAMPPESFLGGWYQEN